MRSSAYNILFLIVSLICPGSYSLSLTKERTGKKGNDETFAHYDWELKENVVPLYTSNADKFAFLSHQSQDSALADVTLADTSSRSVKSKTCYRRIQNTYGKTVYTAISNPWNEVVRVSFTAEEVRARGWGWSANIDTSKCGDTKRSQSDTPDAPATESTAEQPEPELITSNVEASNNETQPADAEANAEFENIGIEMEKMMANVEEKRVSEAHGKKGVCWKESGDMDVICVQVRGRDRTMNYTSFRLPQTADWFDVHNLKTSAMLVLTGNCPNGKCDKFTVRKIEAGDRVSKLRDIEGVDIECAEPSELTMDVADDSAANKSCFTFVCRNKDSSNRNVLQYRKHCINANVFE